MRESFASQFTTDRDIIVYRKYGNGEGVIISAEEHEQFLKQFDKYLFRTHLKLFGLINFVLFVSSALVLGLKFPIDWFFGIFLPPLFLVMAWFLKANHRALGAPALQLADRLPAAPSLDPLEARRRWLKNRDWSTFALGPAAALLIGYKTKFYEAPFALSNVFWTAMIAAILGLFGVQAVRKWRIEREDPSDTDKPTTGQ
jgi:hypothetical protein